MSVAVGLKSVAAAEATKTARVQIASAAMQENIRLDMVASRNEDGSSLPLNHPCGKYRWAAIALVAVMACIVLRGSPRRVE
ncbi:hypothetical protein PY254_08105 [Rhodanobacter sp. AS-Z3]|uniref:hypothetical protein n=1 Tax=Rhodanobacter sp. AS-Z3 TaxID=3031330 RepID=UPI00247B29EC|nr:hypothetical protein [Rhodanobacter sp. AS-Z3]WEN16615.1 hypothetical protein PY254_08105 [Rhodanobacter sp. AS-Z3]